MHFQSFLLKTNNYMMKQYISEGEAIYMDRNFGLFSKRLAEWAIGMMEVKDQATKEMKPLKARTLDDVKDVLKDNKVDIDDELCYTAWYLFNMALADYPKTLKTDELRASYVEETLCDPDGESTDVLECFIAKMNNAGIPIFWEKYL